MVKTFARFSRLLARIWHPVALPEDVAGPLGIEVSNFLSFRELVDLLSKPTVYVSNLSKFMPRKEAESIFRSPTCCESFRDKTLVCYFFNEGWIEFVLCFDSEERLRRIYLNHPAIQNVQGIEIALRSTYIGQRRCNPFSTRQLR
jgi:hypothetical protein